MSDETIDLSKLSEAELHILRLFAQGHTAKSVACETERSVGAVNERLREARRKTGVASSRELARILAAQESRDEKIDLDRPGEEGTGIRPAELSRRWRWRAGGTFVMIAIAVAGALAATLLTRSAAPPAPPPASRPVPIDPSVGSLASSMSPGEQYRQVRQETRDEAWAALAERFIATEYEQVLRSRGVKDKAKVYCAATICEVTLRASTSDAQSAALAEDFQKWSFSERFAAHGYIGKSAGFGGAGPANARAFIHFSYWTKATGNEKRPR